MRPLIPITGQSTDVEVEMEQVPQPTRAISPNSEVGRDEKKIIFESPDSPDTLRTQNEKPALHAEVSLRQLINKLNLLNFQEQCISVVFRHRIYQRTRTFKVRPLPCQDARLICRWDTRIDLDNLLDSFEFQCLYVSKGQQLYEVKARLRSMDERSSHLRSTPDKSGDQ